MWFCCFVVVCGVFWIVGGRLVCCLVVVLVFGGYSVWFCLVCYGLVLGWLGLVSIVCFVVLV